MTKGRDLLQAMIDLDRHGRMDDPYGQVLSQCFQYGVLDEAVRGGILSRHARLQTDILTGNISGFSFPRLPSGRWSLGLNERDQMLGIAHDLISSHLGVVAGTGGGKSYLLFLWLMTLMACVKGGWYFDGAKTQLRSLIRLSAKLQIELAVLGWTDLRINPLQAPGDPRAFVPIITDLLIRVLELPERSATIVRWAIDALYRRFKSYDNATSWPTLFDLYELIRGHQGLNPMARDAIIDRLGALLTSLTPQAAAYRVAWSIDDLASRHLVFELRGRSPRCASLVVNSLLGSLMHRRFERGHAGPPDHLVVIDDAQRTLTSSVSRGGELGLLTEALGLIRSSGVSIMPLFQSLHGVESGLLANLSSIALGRTSSDGDTRTVARSLGLSAQQLAYARRLRRGEFIVRLAESSWPEPFLIRTPPMNPLPIVGDDDVAASRTSLASLKTEFASEFSDWRMMPSAKISEPTPASESESDLNDSELKLLRAIVASPGRPSAEYPKLAGVSARHWKRIRKRFVDEGYVREHSLATARTGRPSIVLEPLEKATLAVKEADK